MHISTSVVALLYSSALFFSTCSGFHNDHYKSSQFSSTLAAQHYQRRDSLTFSNTAIWSFQDDRNNIASNNVYRNNRESFKNLITNTKNVEIASLLQGQQLQSNRRDILLKGAAAVALTAATSINPNPASAYTSSVSADPLTKDTAVNTATSSAANFDCLLDLPPVPSDCIRLYLCRHGQTENNRLRLVQGSRINKPINDNGIKQATNLGKTLGRLPEELYPSKFFHSQLLRAYETALVASTEMMALNGSLRPKIELNELKALMEIDFGPISEGQPVEKAKPAMMATYAAWSMGKIDVRPDGGGDSARDVLFRVNSAIDELVEVADTQTNNRCIAAVSHSSYLRVFLATILEKSLAEVATSIRVENGAINVIDFDRDATKTFTIGPKSNLFLFGGVAKAPDDFELLIPKNNVLRMNENRHLII